VPPRPSARSVEIDPTVEPATYQAADGRSFPAHLFSAKQETGAFKVTVVEMPGEETGPNAAVMWECSAGPA
jgi:hypothetical protein